MRILLGSLALVALAACSQPSATSTATTTTSPYAGAEAVVRTIYDVAQQHIGKDSTPITAIPMTDGLKALVDHAESVAQARDEPFIDGDLALDCQDCGPISDFNVGPSTGPTPEGHTLVQARFKMYNEDHAIVYDMVRNAAGAWQVDNIVSSGFDLRKAAADEIKPLPTTHTTHTTTPPP